MKKKYAKLISLLLTVMLLLTTLFAVTATPSSAAEADLTLYVCSPGYDKYDTTTATADGTEGKPFETVYDLITYVNANTDLGAGDTVNAVILQRDDYNTAFGTTTIDGASTGVHSVTAWTYKEQSNKSIVPAHEFTLNVCSPEGQKNHLAYSAKMGSNVDMMLSGPTIFDNVIILNPYYNMDNKTVCLEGFDVTFTENCAFAWAKMYANGTWSKGLVNMNHSEYMQMVRAHSGTYEYNTPVNINLNAPVGNGAKSPFKFYIPSSRTNNTPVTYNKDVNITVNNANAKLDFNWGIGYATPTLTFGQNLNINIKDATTITNTISKSAIVVTGGLQVIYPEDVTFDMSAITNLTAGSKWFLVNKTGNADAISFTTTAGVYNVAEGLTVTAVDANGNGVKTSENGVLDLREAGAGTYSIVEGEVSGGGSGEEPEPEVPETTITKEYSKYITYRSDLDNTRAKLKANGAVNVVYFGGSVTAGAGASEKDSTSWRALTGNWIKSTFPNANVTNYDQAVGETGTYLGCYRVARDIIGKNPDLLFIEYSINDYYNHTGYARASLQFETIVRQVKEKLPNCEIVTILVTDFNQAKNALKGELHAAAKAHSDISATYGLPVINVGFALADTLGSSWVPAASYKEDAVWGEYVADLVHPKDKGYQVYFNVIKEYLNNNLLYEYNGETAFTELTTLPTMVNKYLLNGDVTFIKPSKDLIVKNEENTSTTRKLAYDTSRGGMCDGYGGTNGNVIWFGSRTDCGDILRFEFTGTEIVMIATALTDGEYSMISIDGGEAYRVDHTSRPVVLATNLSSGKHTIEFKQITKSASLIINGFYTCDFTKATNTLNICDLVKADECINGSATPDETDFFDYSNNWENDVADIDALKQILLNK